MIRLLLGLLIAANVVLFLWIQYGDSARKPDQPTQILKPDFGKIRLVQEMQVLSPPEPQQQDDSSPEPQTPIQPEASVPESLAQVETETPDSESPAPAPMQVPEPDQGAVVETTPEVQDEAQTDAETVATYCGELGPIRSRNMAEGYRRTFFGDESAEVKVEARPGTENVGYWVMIPASHNVTDAEETLKKLQAAGFNDLWLIRKGESRNAISLGLYTKERYAQRHADTIHNKGFDPVVVPKQKNTRVYWVVFSGIGEDKLQDIEDDKLPADAALRKKVCKQALTGN